jgi:hypothetical protein
LRVIDDGDEDADADEELCDSAERDTSDDESDEASHEEDEIVDPEDANWSDTEDAKGVARAKEVVLAVVTRRSRRSSVALCQRPAANLAQPAAVPAEEPRAADSPAVSGEREEKEGALGADVAEVEEVPLARPRQRKALGQMDVNAALAVKGSGLQQGKPVAKRRLQNPKELARGSAALDL